MRERLEFEQIHPDKLSQLKKFAQSFDHDIDHLEYPVWVVKRGERWIAYFQMSRMPIIYPAMHTDPNICSPRDTLEAAEAVFNWARIQFGEGMVAIDPVKGPKFTEEVCEKLGLQNTNKLLYSTRK